MLDQLRHDLQHRLDDLLGKADKLRRALSVLGSGESKKPSTAHNGSRAPRSRLRTPTAPPRGRAAATRTPASTTPSQRAKSAAAAGNGTTARAASGATKNAVLAALASGMPSTDYGPGIYRGGESDPGTPVDPYSGVSIGSDSSG